MSQITENKVALTNQEFKELKEFIYKKCGIHIVEDQRDLLEHKLSRRLKKFSLTSFSQYQNILQTDEEELQEMINAVTTNETYFFREIKHFNFLKDEIIPKLKYDLFRCWSAAGSIGAEAYSIAMHLDACMSTWQNYEVVHSDINSDVSEDAKTGVYPMKFTKKIPKEYLKAYCMQGFDENEGLFMISEKIKRKMKFLLINLTAPLPSNELGEFDVVFLRNMIIYFDDKNKKIIVENVIKRLKPGGYLFMGHSESLYNITDKVKQIKPSIYQKV
jgi:chemotaxis protein methyltransferase CheR